MNNKKVLFFSFVAVFSGSTLMAQNWKTTGNSLTTVGRLGSTNAQDVQFISNNVLNGVLTKNGLWGIGTSAPQSKLHVRNGNSGITPFFQSAITAESSANAYISVLSPSTSEAGILFGNSSGSTSGGIIYNSSFAGSAPNALQFRTSNNFPKMVLTAEGNLGIGITTPKTNLHIFRSSAGVSPNPESQIVAEANGNSFINLLTPVANVSGILFGNKNNAADGGIVYGGASRTMDFRTNGNISRMTLTASGRLGVGTTDPDIFALKVRQNVGGLALENQGNFWEFFIGEPNTNLNLVRNGNPKGFFDASSGDYFTFSDERLKTNIQLLPAVLGKISQLKPSTYQFKNTADKQTHNGFIAQDVMKIFPSLVSHNEDKKRNFDVYTLNYSGFGVIAIKGIQELVKMNEERDEKIQSQQQQIDELQQQLNELKTLLLKVNKSSVPSNAIINTSITGASLDQNIPNPFTNTTTIHYTLPQKITDAQLIITGNDGKTIKQVKLTGSGKGTVNLNAFALSSGTYNYSLLVDGKIISTKQMIIVK